MLRAGDIGAQTYYAQLCHHTELVVSRTDSKELRQSSGFVRKSKLLEGAVVHPLLRLQGRDLESMKYRIDVNVDKSIVHDVLDSKSE